MAFGFGGIHWGAVALSVVASSVLGGVWFTALFGKLYAVALGRGDAPAEKPGPLFIVGPMVCALVTTVTTGVLLRAAAVESASGALVFGLIVGLGYVVSTMVNVAINPNFPRPFLYSAICGPYFLVATVASSLILHAMG